METRELHGLRYRCLEDCGFCCTFTAEVSDPELVRLRGSFPKLPVTRANGMTLLGLQGGCGACTLLESRRCTAYDQRPAHCRYFPFHVYFGRRIEAYVNRSCRGVEAAPAGNLEAEFKAQVLDLAPPFRLRKEQEKADKVLATFTRNAKQAGVWGDVDAEAARLLRRGAAWFDPASWPPTPTGEADEAGSPGEAWQVALAPFGLEDAVARPFHLAADLRWLGFQGGAGGIAAQTLDETGKLEPLQDLGSFEGWPDLPAEVRDGLARVMARLAGRDLLAGSIYHMVDDTGYEIGVADAAEVRFADMAAGLAVRANILHRLGVPWESVAGEAERFYDSAFLDHPTIGGWL
jgi:Fe-S-cluster containining protein